MYVKVSGNAVFDNVTWKNLLLHTSAVGVSGANARAGTHDSRCCPWSNLNSPIFTDLRVACCNKSQLANKLPT